LLPGLQELQYLLVARLPPRRRASLDIIVILQIILLHEESTSLRRREVLIDRLVLLVEFMEALERRPRQLAAIGVLEQARKAHGFLAFGAQERSLAFLVNFGGA